MNAAKDLITNENGWLTDDDSEELAKLLNNIIENGIDSYQRNLCREYAKEYDWNHIALLTENYYLDLLKQSKTFFKYLKFLAYHPNLIFFFTNELIIRKT